MFSGYTQKAVMLMFCWQICVIQRGNLDAPQRSTCLDKVDFERQSLKNLGLMPESPKDKEAEKPVPFWNSGR